MFLWSPHTQLFNIFVPVFAIAAAAWTLRSGLTRRLAIAFGLIIGIGITMYPIFPIALALIVMMALLRPWREMALNLAILAALSVVPYLAWYVFVRLKTGDFYSHEIHGYNQVAWLFDAWREGTLFPRVGEQVRRMIEAAAVQSHVVLGMLAISGLLALWPRKEKTERNDRPALVALAALSAIVVVPAHCSSRSWVSPSPVRPTS